MGECNTFSRLTDSVVRSHVGRVAADVAGDLLRTATWATICFLETRY